MKDRRPVRIWVQILLGLIPIAWFAALYNIGKLRLGLIIFIPIGIASIIGLQMLLPFPYGWGIALIGNMVLWTYLIRKWSIEWNKQFNQ